MSNGGVAWTGFHSPVTGDHYPDASLIGSRRLEPDALMILHIGSRAFLEYDDVGAQFIETRGALPALAALAVPRGDAQGSAQARAPFPISARRFSVARTSTMKLSASITTP